MGRIVAYSVREADILSRHPQTQVGIIMPKDYAPPPPLESQSALRVGQLTKARAWSKFFFLGGGIDPDSSHCRFDTVHTGGGGRGGGGRPYDHLAMREVH